MHNLAVYLTQCLVKNELISGDRREEYQYAVEVVLGKVVNYTTLLIIALITANLIPTVIFMLFFFSLRKRTGGYHAKTALGCYVGTIVSYLIVAGVVVPAVTGNLHVQLIALLISIVLILTLAPVNHPNLGLNEEEMLENKRLGRKVLAVEVIVLGVMILLGLRTSVMLNVYVFIAYGISGIGMNGVLVCMGKWSMQEEKID